MVQDGHLHPVSGPHKLESNLHPQNSNFAQEALFKRIAISPVSYQSEILHCLIFNELYLIDDKNDVVDIACTVSALKQNKTLQNSFTNVLCLT